ncbi:MAG: prolipoprotein diacylglyceryl transferase [Solirubrobacterales bacterium]
MLPEIDLGPITLQTFGIMFALAFLASVSLVWVRLKELGKPTDWAFEMILGAMVGGLIGARVDWIIQNWSDVQGDLLGNVFGGTGLVFFGGLVGGAIGVAIVARYRGMLNLQLLDMAAPAVAIGYAVGRVGCQLAGDGDYGSDWDGPWAMAYPDGTVPIDETVHPTPIYESLTMGLLTLLLWNLRGKLWPGLLMALYLLLGGLERFLIEFIRRNDEVFLGMTGAQLISLAMMIAGAVWLWVVYQRRGSLAIDPSTPVFRSAPAR